MERSAISVSILVLACLVGSAAALGATNVIAYYEYFNATEVDYNMTLANGVDCAPYDANKSYEWRSKYNWTAYCSPFGCKFPATCGLCLNVTNTGTGDQTTVRIVASCSDDDLGLDEPVFDQLDTDGKGKEAGHLIVDYVFVDCGLPINRLYAAQ